MGSLSTDNFQETMGGGVWLMFHIRTKSFISQLSLSSCNLINQIRPTGGRAQRGLYLLGVNSK